MSQIKPISDLEMVEKYLEIRDYVARRTKELEAEMKPWNDKLELIENAFLERLNARGADNSKTEAGTAYKSTRTDVKVEDRSRFLKFCLENWDKWGSDMMNLKATTEHVRHYIDEHSRREPPPGLSVQSHIRVNIRKG